MGDASFIPDLDAWEAWRPDEVASALAPIPIVWAVAGGWAIDLHLNQQTRPHDDIEVAVARADMDQLIPIGDLEWFAVGDGRAWPLELAPETLHQTWGRDRNSQRWRLDVIREDLRDDQWVFRRDPRIRRPVASAIERSAEGIPYLAPEIVLLYKAKAPRPKDEDDLALTLPTLTTLQAEWLRTALEIVHPGHRWTPLIGAAVA